MSSILPSATADDTKPTAYDALMSLLQSNGARLPEAVVAVAEFREQVEREMRQRRVLDALLTLHDWDELIFGGFYCMHCTPDDPDSLDDPTAWPCPTLREAGVTDTEAFALISAHRAAIAARYRAERDGGAR